MEIFNMEINEDVAKKICGVVNYRRFMLIHRRYAKLSKKEKKDFDAYKDKYTPREWRGALMVVYYQKVPFHHKLFKKVRDLYEVPKKEEFVAKYRTVDRDTLLNISVPWIKDKYLKKEFEFQGFLKENKCKIKSVPSIQSNREIGGNIYVYPKKFVQSDPKDGEYIIWRYWGKYGIPGATQLVQQ